MIGLVVVLVVIGVQVALAAVIGRFRYGSVREWWRS